MKFVNEISYSIIEDSEMPRVRKLEAVIEVIKAGYINGVSLLILAKTHGVSEGTIRNILIRHNVPLRNKGRRKGVTNAHQ